MLYSIFLSTTSCTSSFPFLLFPPPVLLCIISFFFFSLFFFLILFSSWTSRYYFPYSALNNVHTKDVSCSYYSRLLPQQKESRKMMWKKRKISHSHPHFTQCSFNLSKKKISTRREMNWNYMQMFDVQERERIGGEKERREICFQYAVKEIQLHDKKRREKVDGWNIFCVCCGAVILNYSMTKEFLLTIFI